MSEEKFTPGEWNVDIESHGVHITPNIAWLGEKLSMPRVENVANAHLIAAAPEMYKELGKLEDVLRGFVRECVPGSGKAYFLWGCIDEILELRKKARGEEW